MILTPRTSAHLAYSYANTQSHSNPLHEVSLGPFIGPKLLYKKNNFLLNVKKYMLPKEMSG